MDQKIIQKWMVPQINISILKICFTQNILHEAINNDTLFFFLMTLPNKTVRNILLFIIVVEISNQFHNRCLTRIHFFEYKLRHNQVRHQKRSF